MNLSYVEGDKSIEYNSKNLLSLNVFSIDYFNLILNDNEGLDLDLKKIIKCIKTSMFRTKLSFVVFDKKDITLKNYLNQIKKYLINQNSYYKIELKIHKR